MDQLRNMDQADIYKAVEYLLTKEYEKEFETIEGMSQHKLGYNFVEWLDMRVDIR